jgi:AbrB family looped-hinge helix DNA binding protein
MAKVTSKLQVTVPKQLADRYGIKPGDEIDWQAAGDSIRVVPARSGQKDVGFRLAVFDQATDRQRRRQRGGKPVADGERGWTREELYGGGSR